MEMVGEHLQRRLTVIDDSPELLALFGDVLRYDGATIALLDGSATLNDVEESDPDLLVIDLRLGTDRPSGLEMIRRLRSCGPLVQTPIVVCSADLEAIAQHSDELSDIPDLLILPKPFSIDELEACVAEALAQDGTP